MSAFGVAGGVLLLIVLAVVRSLVVDEAKGRLSDFSGTLVERAVARLPESRQEDKRAEWMGELEVLRAKPLSALRWSWNLWRSRRSTAHELRADGDQADHWEPEPKESPALSSEPLNPRLQAAVDLAKRFGWHDILAAMVDPGLGEVEKPIGEATDRFCATITETRSAADQVLSRYGPYFDRQTGRRYAPMPVFTRPATVRLGLPVTIRAGRPSAPRPSAHAVLGFLVSTLVFFLVAYTYAHTPLVQAAILGAGMIAWIRTRRGSGSLGHFTPPIVMLAGIYPGFSMLLGAAEPAALVGVVAILLFALRRWT